MIRSAVRLPIPGTAWKRLESPEASADSSSRGGAAGEDRERDLRPDRLDAEQHQEEIALLLGREAVQLQRVVAHDQVAVERHRLAGRRHLLERLARDREPVADAVDVYDDLARPVSAARRAPAGDLAAHQRDHAVTIAAASGARLAWQIATASASAAWSGCGSSASDSSR